MTGVKKWVVHFKQLGQTAKAVCLVDAGPSPRPLAWAVQKLSRAVRPGLGRGMATLSRRTSLPDRGSEWVSSHSLHSRTSESPEGMGIELTVTITERASKAPVGPGQRHRTWRGGGQTSLWARRRGVMLLSLCCEKPGAPRAPSAGDGEHGCFHSLKELFFFKIWV